MRNPSDVSPFNRLLAALPATQRKRVLDQCEPVELVAGATLMDPGQRTRHVLFPVEGYISLIAPISESQQLEVGMVGDEGMHGASVALGMNAAPLRVVVQGAGVAMQLGAAQFCLQVQASSALRGVVHRYLYVQFSQVAQTAACTRFHLVEERLARWLLMTRDRAHSDEFLITHEFLAYMLGVRRVGVTRAARALLERGLIQYSRGRIRILDARNLEDRACSCYERAKETYAAVLGQS